MNVTGIVAIKNVKKNKNENNNTIYTGVVTFKEYAKFIDMPFMLSPRSEAAEKFYDSYIMQPGKSGYCSGKLNSSPNGDIYLNLESIEFGSLKIDAGQSQQQNKQVYNKPTETKIETPSSNFNFNNFNSNSSQSSSDSIAPTTGQNFWGSFGK